MFNSYSRLSQRLVLRSFLALVGYAVLVTPCIVNAQLYWDPGQTPAATAGSGGSGTWNTASAFWDTGSADATWAGGEATFDGTVKSGIVTIASGGVSATRLNFSIGSSYTIEGAPLTLTGDQRIFTDTTAVATISSTLSATRLIKSGSGTLSLSGGTIGTPSALGGGDSSFEGGTTNITGYFNAGGKISVLSGATVNYSAVGTFSTGNYIGINAVGSDAAFNVTGGSLTLSGGSDALYVGNGGTSSASLTVSGGSLIITQARPVRIGAGYDGGSDTVGGGALTISGSGLFTTQSTTGAFQLGPNGTTSTGAGVVNLNGGSLATNRIITKGTSGNATATFNFNGGTLQATGTAMTLSGLTRANVRNGGAVIDTNGFNVAIAQAFVHSDIGGDNAVDGGLTKNGTGTLTLSGLNTYTGNTTVSSGGLTLASTSALTFYIGANGVNNGVGGNGTVDFSGAFVFDLTNASANAGSTWTIVNVSTLGESFSSTFVVQNFTETSLNSGIWVFNGYSFSEATGLLTTSAIPEPSTYALVAGTAGLLFVVGRRRRRSA